MEDSEDWRGCSMEEIYRNLNPFELKHVESVKPSDNHTVLYHYPIKRFDVPPKPLKGHSKWDAYHVRLPSSTKSQYPVIKDDGNTTIESRWEMIQKALLQPIKSSYELEKAILSYNSKYENYWKFRSLHQFFKDMEEDETTLFFNDLLPKIIQLALRLPELITTAIPLLKQNENKSITLSQQQISCLLANAFLCTFPRRNTTKSKSEYSTFPDINFNRLFSSNGNHILEKLKCIFNYFRRVTSSAAPLGAVTFTRRSVNVPNLPKWSNCLAPLAITPLHITSIGTIEDQGAGLLQVDFANKYLGGGVLGHGCVQEEIRFLICPELLISKLFTEKLRPNEALLMIGAEQYSKYSGYSSTFQWDGNFRDKIPYDESRRKQCHIVAIDALEFYKSEDQYLEELMLRELNKAYVGFLYNLDTAAPGIASGNWGCGAFGGDAKLKALIQLMACTITKRPLVYFTFGDKELRDEIHKIHTFFIEENVNVCELWNCLKKFGEKKLNRTELYNFIKQCHSERSKGNSLGESSNANSVTMKINSNNKSKQSPWNISKRLRLPETNKNLSNSIVDLDDEIIPELENDFFNDTLSEKSDNEKLLPLNQTNDLFDESFELQESESNDSHQANDEQATKKLKKTSPNIGTITNVKTEQKIEKVTTITNVKTEKKVEKAKPLKQRTLIDMLDFFYDKK